VGFDLYAELVAEAVHKLEGRTLVDDAPPEVRIELPIDAHLPEEYVDEQQLRLEAYRRLALSTTHEEVDEVTAEWLDRFGEPPQAALALVSIAHLRVEALRIGLSEIVKLHHEVRIGPVDLTQSQEIRLARLHRRAVLRATEGVIFLPAPEPLVDGLLEFLEAMWPTPHPATAAGSPGTA
jgi:transcription-repair coupling factor (superfamily II helicase)